MAKDREHLSIEDDQIDLEDLVISPQTPPSEEEYKKMQEVGEKLGFVDRSSKTKKKNPLYYST